VPSAATPLYHPRHWPTWLLIGLLKLFTLLPFTTQLWFGRLLGRSFMRVGRQRRHITQVNLALCFPELSDAQRQDLLVRTFEAQGMGLMETTAAWLMPPRRLLPRVELTGVEAVTEAQRQGRAVLLLGGHYTTLDISGTLLGHFTAFDVIFRKQKNPVINYMMERGRQKYLQGGRTLSQKDMREVYRSLAEKRVLWYPPDQDYGAKHSVFAPFFGVPAAVIKAPTRMAKKYDAAVFACWSHRTPDARYQVHIAPLEGFTAEDYEADARAINGALERAIRQYPEQYMWVHRRFKSRPPGEPSVY
jgi:KDO2-lipid IV(A) lauroyltransferase